MRLFAKECKTQCLMLKWRLLGSTRAYRFTIFGKLAKLKLKREELGEGPNFTFSPCSKQQGC